MDPLVLWPAPVRAALTRTHPALEPEQILVPGLGRGEVRLDVYATIVPKTQRLRAPSSAGRAAKEVLIARSSKRLTQDYPFSLTLVPTAEGKRLLGGPHPKLKARYVLSLTPEGSKRTITKSATFTIPAVD